MSLTLSLAVNSLEKTAGFYEKILKKKTEYFVSSPGAPPVLLLCQGDAAIVFRQTSHFEALHPALFQNLDRHPRGVGMALELSVQDLNAVLENIERHRLPTLYELNDEEFGRREIWLHDPDGYLIVLCEEA